MAKKFVIAKNQVIIGDTEFHWQLWKEKSEIEGGGYWHFDKPSNTFYLYGKSFDFGPVTKEQIDKAYFHYRDGLRDCIVVFSEEESLKKVLPGLSH